MDARKRGLIIDIGGFVFPNAAGASLGPLLLLSLPPLARASLV
jgi:hypothetical protein